MSLTGGHLDALVAAGATVEQIVALVKADMAERERALEDRRSKDRDRQRRKRCHAESRGFTRTKCDTPPNDNILTPPDLPPKPIGLDPKPKKHRLPVDWEPKPFTPGTLAAQTVLRWEPGRLERELSKFRDHHTAAGTRWENWQAAWSKWVNNSEDFNRGGNVRQIGKSAAAYASLVSNLAPDEPF